MSGAAEPVVIRPARASDAATLADIVAQAYDHYVARIGRPPGPMLDDYAVRIAAGQAHVALSGDAILGLIVLEPCPDGALLLDNVAVLPKAQGSGVGRALVLFAEAETLRRGGTVLRLYTHERMVENIALYSRLGFVETGRVTEKGFARVYMEKSLGQPPQ